MRALTILACIMFVCDTDTCESSGDAHEYLSLRNFILLMWMLRISCFICSMICKLNDSDEKQLTGLSEKEKHATEKLTSLL